MKYCLFIITCIAFSLICCNCRNKSVLETVSHDWLKTKKYDYTIDYGYCNKGKSLAFLVIHIVRHDEGREGIFQFKRIYSVFGNEVIANIMLPNGDEIPLPDSQTQIFEYKDACLKRHEITITKEEFIDFFLLNSDRDDYSVDALKLYLITRGGGNVRGTSGVQSPAIDYQRTR